MQVTTVKNQNLRDIAAQYYGNTSQSVLDELISLNENLLKNDFSKFGYIVETTYFYVDIPIIEATTLTVDENSSLRNITMLNNMSGENITTG